MQKRIQAHIVEMRETAIRYIIFDSCKHIVKTIKELKFGVFWKAIAITFSFVAGRIVGIL